MRLSVPTVATLVLLAGACSTSEPLPTDAEEAAYQEQFPPAGEPQDYFLHTHCGLRPVRVGGRWWVPVSWDGEQDLPSAEDVTEQWGDYEQGRLTYDPPDDLSFTAGGVTIEYTRDTRPEDFCR